MPVLRKPAASSGSTRRRPSAAVLRRRPSAAVLRRPAARGSKNQPVVIPRKPQQELSPSAFPVDLFIWRVRTGRSDITDCPSWEHAEIAAKQCNIGVPCAAGCNRRYHTDQLPFRQWAPNKWTAYCQNCSGYESD